MGFHQGGYCHVWSVESGKTGKITKVRLSSSRKNKQTDEYEQDFSGFCTFIGKANEKARGLKERDRIKILECDVSTNYDREKQKEYVNYKVFDFEMAGGGTPTSGGKSSGSGRKTAFEADDGEVEAAEDLPF